MKIAPRAFYGTILVTFGVILEAQGLLLGAAEPVGILVNFRTSHGATQVEGTGSVGGQALVPRARKQVSQMAEGRRKKEEGGI